jgi:pimeloyl-ACP methyl ester carboxylesterase
VRPLRDELWTAALCWNMTVPPEVRAALIARQIDSDDVLAQLSIPVLVTHGRRDRIVLPSMADHTLEICETATASWYDSAGHMPFLEETARFNQELAEFVHSVRP